MSANDRKAELERKKAKLAALRDIKLKRDKFKNEVSGSEEPVTTQTQCLRIETDELLKTLGIPLVDDTTLISEKRRVLGFSQVTETHVLPKECITYSKPTQTHDTYTPVKNKYGQPRDIYKDSPHDVPGSLKSVINLEWDDEFSAVIPFDDSISDSLEVMPVINGIHKMPLVTSIAPAQTCVDKERERGRSQSVKILDFNSDEYNLIMRSDNFQHFFNRASKLVERALDEPVDLFVDYSGADRDDNSKAQRHQLVRTGREFFDERWSRRRTVTSLDWSPTFPELLLASYYINDEVSHDPDGVCLIWNLKFQKNTPEYIFNCQSPITSATMALYHPNLVIGGTYSGQIVLWDNRTTKRTPVQRTPFSTTAHTHPVHSVMIAGTQNAHNLVSISSDGRLCFWSLDMLGQPQQHIDLAYKQTRSVAATCMSFVDENVNHFLVGCEDGRIYAGSRHGTEGSMSEAFEGHQAPITSISTHPHGSSANVSPLFLTTSLDWSVKLWSIKDGKLISSFEESSDYVFDADWSPLHPAIFATADCMGRLDLWNLNQDTEVPSARTVIEGQPALNRCQFHSSGLHIAAGDDNGRIHILDLNENMVTPHADEWNTFNYTINELRQLAFERKEIEIDINRQSANSQISVLH